MKKLHRLIVICVIIAVLICGCNSNQNNKKQTVDSTSQLKHGSLLCILLVHADMDNVIATQ